VSKSILFSLVLVSGLVAAPAALADYYNPGNGYGNGYGNGWTSCRTSSQGRQFQNADYGIESARSRAINDCQQDSYTNSGECRYNISCDGESPGAYARCTTQSQGRNFLDGSSDASTARDSVINRCIQDSYTNNGECRYNVRCEGGASYYPPQPQPQPPVYVPYPPQPQPQPGYNPPQPPYGNGDPNRMYACTTQSNGRSFSVPGRGYNETRYRVILVCQQSAYTDKQACDYNAYCQ
jgi:hypothetical protein